MSEDTSKNAAPTASAPEKKSKGGIGLVAAIVPALLAAGAAFGGTRAAMAKGGSHAAEPAAHHREVRPPGPTVALDPFLIQLTDSAHKAHPVKLTIAVEFDSTTKEEAVKPFIPRLRDAMLAHVRTLPYEDATDSAHSEKLRAELVERCRSIGAHTAEKVLITDLVSQ
jgi:flagellar basal body-associated protein FliL